MRGQLRDHDVVARYGGDEFVVLLPYTSAEGGRVVADRIAANTPVPCSIGLAQWEDTLGADALLERADRALLLAKRTGKHRVTVADARLENELDLTDARIGSPGATLRDFWEMVAGSDSARDALETLPAFLRRVTGAEEVALYELERSGDEASGRGSGGDVVRRIHAHRRSDSFVQGFTCERLAAGPALAERLALGAFARPSLAVLLATLDVESTDADLDAPTGSYAAIPLLHAGHAQGLLVLRLERELRPERLRQIEGLARQTMAMFGAREETGSPAAVQALAAAIEARDNYTHQHSEQVVALATDVARLLGLSPADLERVRHGALLHDVGKLAIPNEILHKPGPLTDAEWRVMAEHPVIGERILRRTPQLGHLAPIVRHEHERWDGGGYPDGLAAHRDPDRLAHHPRLRRLQRDDHHAALPRGDVDRARDRGAARQGGHAVRPAGGRGAARAPRASATGRLRGLRRLRRRDQRRAVGQARGPVQAAVLREVAQVELRGLDARLLAAVARAARAPRGVVAHAERERRRPARDGQRDQVALLDVEGAAERELDGRAEPRRQALDRALAGHAAEQLGARLEHRDAGRRRRRRSSR